METVTEMTDERLAEMRETCIATPELAVGPVEEGFLTAMTIIDRLRAELAAAKAENERLRDAKDVPLCEAFGCAAPATTHDADGMLLCQECGEELVASGEPTP